MMSYIIFMNMEIYLFIWQKPDEKRCWPKLPTWLQLLVEDNWRKCGWQKAAKLTAILCEISRYFRKGIKTIALWKLAICLPYDGLLWANCSSEAVSEEDYAFNFFKQFSLINDKLIINAAQLDGSRLWSFFKWDE